MHIICKFFPIKKFLKTLILNFFELNTHIFKSPYPSQGLLEELSQKLQINQNKIRFWFKNRRIKDFKTSKHIIKTFKVTSVNYLINIQIMNRKIKFLTRKKKKFSSYIL